VNEQLRLLVELQNIDTSIISIRKQINSLPLKNSDKQKELNSAYSSYKTSEESLRSLEKEKRDKERSIEELDIKIKKLRDKAADIKTNKEYQAYIKEIENMQQELTAVEDELLHLMEALDEQRKVVEIKKAKVSEEEKKLKEQQDKIQIEKNNIEETLRLLMQKRNELTTNIEKENYIIYMNVFKSCNGQAVVEVKNEICQGCNLHIPPQQYVEIKNNKEITFCPQCRRILYYNKTTEFPVKTE